MESKEKRMATSFDGKDCKETQKRPPWDLDTALRIIGPRGRWQMGVYALICLMYTTLAFHFLAFVFQVDTPSHHCKIPANRTKNNTIPKVSKDGKLVDDSCNMYIDLDISNKTIPCPDGWDFDPNSGYIRTIVTDFNLVCGANILVEVSMMVSSAAMALGQVFANRLADTFGRKKVFVFGCIFRALTGIAKAFAPNMITYIILDGLCWVSMTCFATMLLLLCCELFPPEYRSFAGTTIEFAWFASMMLCSMLVYLLRDWRTLQLVMYCPVLLGIVYIWLVPESLPWLIVSRKYDIARRYIELGSRINKKPIPPGFFEGGGDNQLNGEAAKEPELAETINFGSTASIAASIAGVTKRRSYHGSGPVWVKMKESTENLTSAESGKLATLSEDPVVDQVSWLDVWKSKRLTFVTIVLFMLWFTNSIVYSSLNLTVTYLSGDRYLNFSLLALAELPAIICFHWGLNRFGRRLPLCVFHVIAGIALLLTLVEEFALHSRGFSIALNFIGKFGITASYCSILVYSPELYPTSIRSVYFGMCFFWALSANLIAPYCRPIERAVPGIVRGLCGSMSLIVAVLVVFLPETFRRALPSSIAEVERWTRNVSPEEVEKYDNLRKGEYGKNNNTE